ncbi:MAG TPA: CU044_2847 family protein [Pilimelia sp.]|nr:CU044_2847 family protein [Pilimelia sp.]
MATTHISVPLDEGSAEFIEVEVDRRDLEGVELVAAGDGHGPARALFTVAESFDRVVPALSEIVTRLRAAAHTPDEICMQLGLAVGGETGLIFTKGTAGANFTVTMTWKKPGAAA